MNSKLLDSDFYFSSFYKIKLKGFILYAGKRYEAEEMAKFAFEIIKNKEWEKLNGRFLIIFYSKNKTIILSDIIRSYPIFYRQDGETFYLSQNPVNLLKIKPINKLNTLASEVFIHSAFCLKNNTLVENIYQNQAAEILYLFRSGIALPKIAFDLSINLVDYSQKVKHLDSGLVFDSNSTLKSTFYTDFRQKEKIQTNFQLAKSKLKSIIFEIFKDYTPLLKSKPIILPLSGGTDSRLIAYMLNELEIKDVLCFTYGKKENKELEISKRVAQKLNFKWLFVDYEKHNLPPLTNNEFTNYLQFMGNFTAMPYLQEYLAVKYLKENDLVCSDSIFIPGHSADFTAGSHLNPLINSQSTKSKIIDYVLNRSFNLNGRIDFQKIDLKHFDFKEIENFDYRERQAKFIVNSARIFDYFSFSYILPFWDRRFHDFFRTLPYSYRLYKKLYNSVVTELFESKKINFDLTITSPSDFRFQSLKSRLKKHLSYFIKNKRLKNQDWMNYETFTSEMLAKLQKQNYKFQADGYNAIISAWYLNYIQEKFDIIDQ